MIDGFAIAFPCTTTTVYADPFLEIGGKFLEGFEKQAIFVSETQIGIFDFLGRDERFPVADGLIVLADLGADIVQMAVDAIRFDTLAFGATAADFPRLSGTLSFALNWAILPLTVIRPMTGTANCFLSLFLSR